MKIRTNSIRVLTATSKYDGHTVSINTIRKLLVKEGAEVIHVGHNRSIEELVTIAEQEGVDAVAVSSYQGGHMDYYPALKMLLNKKGLKHICVFGGGGGTITEEESKILVEEKGITGIYRADAAFDYIIKDIFKKIKRDKHSIETENLAEKFNHSEGAISDMISLIEAKYKQDLDKTVLKSIEYEKLALEKIIAKDRKKGKIIGITGDGGAGKSTLIDEIIGRYIEEFGDKKIAIVSVDTKTGIAGLLGDRMNMNNTVHDRVYMRSMLSSGLGGLSDACKESVDILRNFYDLVLVETVGTGQLGSNINNVCDASLHVMTKEYGNAAQLDKIAALNKPDQLADFIVVNKFDRLGSMSAYEAIKRKIKVDVMLENESEAVKNKQMVFGTRANKHRDSAVYTLYDFLMAKIGFKSEEDIKSPVFTSFTDDTLLPLSRRAYIGEIADFHDEREKYIEEQVGIARDLFCLKKAETIRRNSGQFDPMDHSITKLIEEKENKLSEESKHLLKEWESIYEMYETKGEVGVVSSKGGTIEKNFVDSLSGTKLRKVAIPDYEDLGEILRYMYKENVPGRFPFTAGIYSFRAKGSDITRQFAGLRTAEETNKRFHFISKGIEKPRLSTAFDAVTLYGDDPDGKEGLYGKIGEAGVGIYMLDHYKKLFDRFDLDNGNTSVSLTINGPAVTHLSWLFLTAIDKAVDRFKGETKRDPNKKEYDEIKKRTLQNIRGTIQADILKEEIAQKSSLFSTDFAMKLLGDWEEYFIKNNIKKFYAISISGYHIEEAGSNPVQEAAYVLSNAFTYVEYFLSRGLHIDDFVKNLSFFLSSGLDPEFSVTGNVMRRIWANIIKHKYHGNEESQKLKYHVQTSGRSLVENEYDVYNDIRTTIEALKALRSNCNSLHTNSADEAYTTPTEKYEKKAMGIQRVLDSEDGDSLSVNALQGSFYYSKLEEEVERGIIKIFREIDSEGGVLSAIENHYQQDKIIDESIKYSFDVITGKRVVCGVNQYVDKSWKINDDVEYIKSTEEDKQKILREVNDFKKNRDQEKTRLAMKRIKEVGFAGGNIFEVLVNEEAARWLTAGEITSIFYNIGGVHRRSP